MQNPVASGDSPRRKPQPQPRHNNPWYFVLLCLVLFAPFALYLLAPGGRVLGNSNCDNPSAYYFINYFAAQCWRQGTIPLWNPYIMLGIPFVGEGQAAVFHPLSWLFIFLQTGVAINWLIGLSFMLTGLFFYGYLRALGLGRPAAWCGAVTWSFSNVMIARIYAGHLNILLTYLSIPPMMMFWEKYRAGGGVRWLAGISLAYALMILGAYPQVLYIFSLFFLCYVLIQSGLAIRDRASARREGGVILRLGVFILLGIGLGAIQLLPSLDFAAHSFRQSVNFAFSSSFSYPPENLLMALAPGFFGNSVSVADRLYWARFNYWEMVFYLGLLPLMAAAVGVWAAPARRRAALLACTVIFFVIGLGNNTPLFSLVYKFVPGYSLFRCPCKNMLITLLGLVTFSAYGFESLFTEQDEARRRRARRIALAAGGVLLLATAGLWLGLLDDALAPASRWRGFVNWVDSRNWIDCHAYFFDRPIKEESYRLTATGATRAIQRALLLLVLSLALVGGLRPPRWRGFLFPAAALLILADLLGFFLPLLRSFDESITAYSGSVHEELHDFVKDYPYPPRILNPGPMPNIAIRYGYSSAFGYVGNTLQRYNDFINVLQGESLDHSRAGSFAPPLNPQFKLLAFDAVVANSSHLPPDVKILQRLDGQRVLVPFEVLQQQKIPRAFLAAAPRYFARREDALKYIFTKDTDVAASPAIESLRADVAPAPLEEDESVRIISHKPQRVELEVRARRPRELVWCSMFERNWRAHVNGRRIEIKPANFIFRAVRVPAGTSRVVFKYHPLAFYWGAAVSAASLLVLLLAGTGAWRRLLPQRLPGGLPGWISRGLRRPNEPPELAPPVGAASRPLCE